MLMAANLIITLFVILLALFQSTISVDNQDLSMAIEEMQKANYFTFVMLINMFPLDRKLHANVTFLMPKDIMLSKTAIPQSSVPNFLHRHSIPTPLLFEHLLHIPTGSFLPSSEPDYMFNISNGGGRRSFFLNNVRIISPNICSATSSISCHGIDGVLSEEKIPSSVCSNNTGSSASSTSPVAPPPLSFLPHSHDFPVVAPQAGDHSSRSSGSSQFISDTEVMLIVVGAIFISII